MAGTAHDKVEKNVGLLFVLTFLVILVGALVEIVPLFFQKSTTTKRSTLGEAMKVEDLNSPQFTFVALKGSTSEAVTRKGAPQAKLLTVNTENEGVQLVIDGKADGMLADYPICVVAAYRNQGSGLVPVAAPLTYEPIGIAVPKGDPQLLNWLQNFMHSIEKAGYMKDLGEKWFAKPTWVDQLK